MDIYCHRGNGFGLPEGSIAAFERAVHAGFYYEADLRLLRDGIVVVHHDPEPGRVFQKPKGKHFPIEGMETVEFVHLSARHDGGVYRPALLSDLLLLMRECPAIKALWELKAPSYRLAEEVARSILARSLQERVTVIALPANAEQIGRLAECGVRTGVVDTFPNRMLSYATARKANVVLTGWLTKWERVKYQLLDPVYIRTRAQSRALHEAGKSLVMGVAQSARDIRYFEWSGADGVVTDVIPR